MAVERKESTKEPGAKTVTGESAPPNFSSDPRFVRYYEAESLSPAAIERFRFVRDKVLGLAARQGHQKDVLKVLDIGCGAGSQSFVYAELDHHAVGIDVNEPLIQIARKRAQASKASATFELGSAAALPFGDASFDVCLLNELLEHVQEWRQCLNEATRVLKPGGILYVSTTNYLCPRQQEFELPLYSWYPAFLKRRCEELARTTKPELANYATYPAVNWFSYWSLKEYLGTRGMTCLDRFDLMDESTLPPLLRPALFFVRKLAPFRMLAYTLVSGSIVYGIKRSGLRLKDDA